MNGKGHEQGETHVSFHSDLIDVRQCLMAANLNVTDFDLHCDTI